MSHQASNTALASLVVLFLASLFASLRLNRGVKRGMGPELAAMGFRFRELPSHVERAGIPHADESGSLIRDFWLQRVSDVRIRIYAFVHVHHVLGGFRGDWSTCVLLDGARLALGEFSLELKHGLLVDAVITGLMRRHATGPAEFVTTGIPFVDANCRVQGHPDVQRVFCPAMIELLRSVRPLLIESRGDALLIRTVHAGVGGLDLESFLALARASVKLAAAYGGRPV